MMATRRYVASEPALTGSQPGGGRCCKISTDKPHKLVSAKAWFTNIVGTGDLTLELRSGDRGDSSTGRLVGYAMVNADLLPDGLDVTGQINSFEFTLNAEDKELAPAARQYWLTRTGDNAADRLDEPMLEIVVDE